MTYSPPPPYRDGEDPLTTCDGCGVLVPSTTHELHTDWHTDRDNETEAVNQVIGQILNWFKDRRFAIV
jgi:hypothetical protein